MAKSKFVLSSDLVKVEKEPQEYVGSSKSNNVVQKNDRITISIESELKEKLQIYCVRNKKNMTDILNTLLNEFFETRS